MRASQGRIRSSRNTALSLAARSRQVVLAPADDHVALAPEVAHGDLAAPDPELGAAAAILCAPGRAAHGGRAVAPAGAKASAGSAPHAADAPPGRGLRPRAAG